MQRAHHIELRTTVDVSQDSESPVIGKGGRLVQGSVTSKPRSPAVATLIGDTPLIPLQRVTSALAPEVALYAKLEGLNPGGSVKDRPALLIVRRALCRGNLAGDRTLLDATSGNTGIAYAMLGAAFGFPVQLILPADVSAERVQILRAYGAQLVFTDPANRTDGARQVAQQLADAQPASFFYADQYNNPANALAHATSTGPEIWSQTGGRVTHFVAGLGTGGTMTGVGAYLRAQNRDVHLVGVQPDRPRHGISGLKHLKTADLPGNYDPTLVDLTQAISSEEARGMARRLARQEGIFVGISSGAAVAAALRMGRALTRGLLVALLPDGGFKYAGDPFWAE